MTFKAFGMGYYVAKPLDFRDSIKQQSIEWHIFRKRARALAG